MMIEASCTKCRETFNPADERDLEHVETVAGEPCGGIGEIVREIPMSGWMLTDAIVAVRDSCKRAGVDDYDGEAVSFLDALLRLGNGTATTADGAVATAYGVIVPEGVAS